MLKWVFRCFDEIYLDIDYPSYKYQEIFNDIVEIKKSTENKIKIEIQILNIETTENPLSRNK